MSKLLVLNSPNRLNSHIDTLAILSRRNSHKMFQCLQEKILQEEEIIRVSSYLSVLLGFEVESSSVVVLLLLLEIKSNRQIVVLRGIVTLGK